MRYHGLIRSVTTILITGFVGACASASSDGGSSAPPPTRQFIDPSVGVVRLFDEPGTEARIVKAPTQRVWATLPAVFELLEIPADVVNHPGLEIGTQGYRPRRVEGKRLSDFLNCGASATGQRADNYDVTMSVATRLTGQDSTFVHTTVTANAKPRTVSGGAIACSTRGVLEMRVTQLIVEQLRAPRQ